MSWFKSIAVASALAVTATAGAAATVNLSSVSGVWQNTVTAGNPVAGEGTSVISWGPPSNPANLPSSYEFNAVPTPQNAVVSPFELGEFVHNNFTISLGNQLLSADLQVSISGDVDGELFNLNPVFSFTHFETPNGSSPCAAGGSNPCPDLVTLVNQQDLSAVQTLANGDEFTLTILGFDTGGGPLTSFLTKEAQSNKAKLIATFSIEPGGVGGEIPLPAAGWLLLGSLGVLSVAKRRRRKAA